MKKVILVLCLVAGLSGSEMVCDDAYGRFVKYNDLFNMAFERDDFRAMRVDSAMRIQYIESAIVECVGFYDISKLKAIRASAIHTSDLLKGAVNVD